MVDGAHGVSRIGGAVAATTGVAARSADAVLVGTAAARSSGASLLRSNSTEIHRLRAADASHESDAYAPARRGRAGFDERLEPGRTRTTST